MIEHWSRYYTVCGYRYQNGPIFVEFHWGLKDFAAKTHIKEHLLKRLLMEFTKRYFNISEDVYTEWDHGRIHADIFPKPDELQKFQNAFDLFLEQFELVDIICTVKNSKQVNKTIPF